MHIMLAALAWVLVRLKEGCIRETLAEQSCWDCNDYAVQFCTEPKVPTRTHKTQYLITTKINSICIFSYASR